MTKEKQFFNCNVPLEEYYKCQLCGFRGHRKMQLKTHDCNSVLDFNFFHFLVPLGVSEKIVKKRKKNAYLEENQNNNGTLGEEKWSFEDAFPPLENEDGFWLCDMCPYKAKNKLCVFNHIISKHICPNNMPLLKCDKCDFKFMIPELLNAHIKRKHSNEDKGKSLENRKKFACDYCNLKGITKNALTKHIILKHKKDDEIEWFKCTECDYKAKLPLLLKRHHVKVHINGFLVCDICDYQTKFKDNWRKHKQKHKNPKNVPQNFQCDKCDYKTKSSKCFEKHQLKHPVLEEVTVETNAITTEAKATDTETKVITTTTEAKATDTEIKVITTTPEAILEPETQAQVTEANATDTTTESKAKPTETKIKTTKITKDAGIKTKAQSTEAKTKKIVTKANSPKTKAKAKTTETTKATKKQVKVKATEATKAAELKTKGATKAKATKKIRTKPIPVEG